MILVCIRYHFRLTLTEAAMQRLVTVFSKFLFQLLNGLKPENVLLVSSQNVYDYLKLRSEKSSTLLMLPENFL